ncbi:MAG: hypothetical protein PHX62_06530 [Bacilli bacterium]|nr:hypothetical protein [Bacilli bacterium]
MNLNQQIADMKQVVGQKDIYERKLRAAEVEYCKAKRAEVELKDILIKEKKDVHKLESFSLINLWYSLRGSKDERIEKEKQELSQAEYRYKIIKTTVFDLSEEIADLKHKLEKIKNSGSFLEKLYNQKEAEILKTAGINSDKIKTLNSKIEAKKREINELKEGIEAGKALAMGMRNVLVNLEKASQYGTWDMLGGGLFIDILKHNQIDQAKRNLEDLKYLADKFIRELKDVNLVLDLDFEIDQSLSFLDWFFDGFFVDMFVKNEIDKARMKFETEIKLVEKIIEELKSDYDKISLTIADLNFEKSSLL